MKTESQRITIRKILVPVDFSSYSKSTIEYASMIAERFDATVILMHVIDSAPYSVTDTFKLVDHQKVLQTLAGSLLQSLVEELRARNLEVKSHLVWGNPNREILDKSQREKVDLIVMGTHGRTGLPHVIMGSVAEKTVRLSRVPVLTVPLSPEAPATKRASSELK